MTSLYDLKTTFLARLRRQRDEAQQQLDLFLVGTITMHKNRVDITASQIDQLRQTIADYDGLLPRLSKNWLSK